MPRGKLIALVAGVSAVVSLIFINLNNRAAAGTAVGKILGKG